MLDTFVLKSLKLERRSLSMDIDLSYIFETHYVLKLVYLIVDFLEKINSRIFSSLHVSLPTAFKTKYALEAEELQSKFVTLFLLFVFLINFLSPAFDYLSNGLCKS